MNQEQINEYAEKIFYVLFPEHDPERPSYIDYNALKEAKLKEIKEAINIQLTMPKNKIPDNLYGKIACGYNSPSYYTSGAYAEIEENIEIFKLPE